jgi:hypothetical protein
MDAWSVCPAELKIPISKSMLITVVGRIIAPAGQSPLGVSLFINCTVLVENMRVKRYILSGAEAC